jgi:hypothetical protein
MPDLDLVIRNGTVVTAADSFRADVGVRAGRIVALAEELPRGAREIDAAGRLVLPGGVDSHCHIEQLSGMGIWNADDFESTRSTIWPPSASTTARSSACAGRCWRARRPMPATVSEPAQSRSNAWIGRFVCSSILRFSRRIRSDESTNVANSPRVTTNTCTPSIWAAARW